MRDGEQKRASDLTLLATEPDSRCQPIVRIGRGGMAEIMLASLQGNGVTKLAVLKCLWPELAEDPSFVQMFLNEARLCARLNHPNVVQTYEVLRHGGRLAMAMEYLEGQPLTSVLSRLIAELGLPTRLRIITSILAGLEYAHGLTDFDGTSLNVVHRDVSPHNVFVTYDGHVKLLDFGIAKTLAAEHQTQPGGVRGKLAYLAPEALRGDAVDRRADLFSVGVMLWEVVAGRRLWDSRRQGGLPWCLAPAATPPELPAELDLPDELRAVCRRALALDVDARYASAAELAADLERFGALGSDAHPRHLGRLVSLAFASERAQRCAIVEFHLRGDVGVDVRSDLADYASYELAPSEPTVTAVTIARQRRIEVAPVVEPAVDVASVGVVTPALAAPTATKKRRHGGSRLALVAGAAAVLALGSGARFGPLSAAWPAAKTWLGHARAAAIAAGLARVEALETAGTEPAPTTVAAASAPKVEPAACPEVQAAVPRAERRDHHAHPPRARPLDLSDDDVLDIDGSPLPPSRGSGVSRD